MLRGTLLYDDRGSRLAGIGIATLALAVVLAVALPGSRADGSVQRDGGSYCSLPVIRDYEQPLASLPPVRRLPGGGHLPFAPADATVRRVSPSFAGRVVAGGGSFGYAIVNEGGRRIGLEWIVSARMSSVNHRGRTRRVLENVRRHIGAVRGSGRVDAVLPTGTKPGLYRFDIAFRDRRGAWLGRYSEYLRVVQPSRKVRLGLSGRRFQPGEVLSARVENLGTETVRSTLRYSVERWSAPEWIPVQPSSARRRWPLSRAPTRLGRAGGCTVVRLSQDLTAGRYRLVKAVEYDGGAGRSMVLSLTAEFEVVP